MKKLFTVLLIGAILGVGVALFLWNKPKKSAASESVFATRSATELYMEFSADPAGAFQIYNQKNIEVKGIMESFSQDSSGTKITLQTQSNDAGIVTIGLAEKQVNLPAVGDSIVLRGLCAGFIEGMDMLGGEVQLNQGIIIE